MSKPVAIPNTFATATTVIPLSNLDQNFTAVATSINSALTYSNYAADTGAADAYVVTFTGLAAAYAAGLRIQFRAANANTGASTINVNAQGTKNITFQNAAALTAGIIAANSIVDVMYDGTQFLLMNDPAGLTGGDVVGPASATDNAVVRFDGTTGKLVQNSVVTIADTTGDIAGAGSITSTSASGILTRAAATQDGVELIGRAGGSSSYKVTLTPTTLGGNRTLTLPDTTGTVALTGSTVASFSAGSTGFTPNSATTGAVTLAGTLATTNGGTGLTSFTANGVVYASSSSALATGSALTFDGSTLGVGGGVLEISRPSGFGNTQITVTNNGAGASGFIFGQSAQLQQFFIYDTGAAKDRYLITSTGEHIWLGASEQMRLTSTGLGIGTSSPGTKLQITSGAVRVTAESTTNSSNAGYRWSVKDSGGNVGNSGIYVEPTASISGRYFGFAVDDSTYAMVLNNSGNLGIGTSSPAYRLQVQSAGTGTTAASNIVGRFQTNGSGYDVFVQLSDNVANSGGIGMVGGAMYLANGTTRNLTLDSSGNLGLGVTPSAWSSGSSMDVGAQTSVHFSVSVGTLFGKNVYFNAGYKYKATGTARAYIQDDGGHSWFTAPSGTAGNAITFTQAMTLDASGNLGVGSTNPSGTAGYRYVSILDGSNGSALSFRKSTNSEYGSLFATASDNSINLYSTSAGPIIFGTNAIERARITSGGYFKASDDGVYAGAANTWHEFNQSANSLGLAVLADNASFASTVVEISATRNTTNNTYYFLDCAVSGVAYRLRVADSGNVTNTNGSYGTISDAKMKTDIVDAGSQWADIKAIRFRKFKMKNDPSGLLQLGVVAQELEQTSPGLVEQHIDRDAEGNDLGTTTKSVKTSILLMKAAKALQEAMARIETLEAKVAQLEGA